MTAVLADATDVRTELLDCIQANLAVLADRWGGPLRHLALGATLRFAPRTGPDGLPTVDPAVESHVAEATGLVGLTTGNCHHDLRPDRLRVLAAQAPVVYAVGDSYHMPWLPYAGHSHMEHSFLVAAEGDEAVVVDAYDNETAWGPARPGRWKLPWHRLPTVTLATLPAASAGYRAPAPAVHLADPASYVEAYESHPDRLAALRRLTAETWLMTRARRLHAAYRLHRGEHLDAQEHLQRWDKLTAAAFIALRRAERGRPTPGALLPDLAAALTADRAVLATPTDQKETP
ncbi:hypothetical protein [Streptomyces candidus]|uniref:Uncharacterized protein n=1 Tax=Streptomyces candidus TaxID=67283 RepID=A0A7X0HLJ8_9ACTN|nr:hypothetical protein [Streptomyces candidus]MBB6438622.1 hypothetical protein [Streptomyces candidus]GHH45285.1 hypothetical protein GCM10018773_34300 [Streptomyces candidus]